MMDAESVREAADRLSRVNDGEDCESVYGDEWYHGELKDRVKMSDAYLRELSTEGISAERLKADGWEFDGEDWNFGKAWLWPTDLSHIGGPRVIWMGGNEHWTAQELSNMGHVRTLLRLSEGR